MQQASFLERSRTTIIGAIAVIAVIGVGFLALQTAGASNYVCSTAWTPDATAAPQPGATQALGYVQPDLGKNHSVDSPQRYTLCPPASGNHHGAPLAPIPARVYGAEDDASPTGWIHNLEHGGLVLLYRCADGDTACSEGGRSALDTVFANFPNSPVCNLPKGGSSPGPVFARFDEMAWPYAAILWNRVLPLDTLDADAIYEFFAQFAEKTAPEPQCALPTPTPLVTPEPSGGPSASASATAAPSATTTAAPSATATPEPSETPESSETPQPTSR